MVVVAAICLTVAGCQTGNSVWSKPAYQAAPATNGARRTYTPTESVSPYQQHNSYGGGSSTHKFGAAK